MYEKYQENVENVSKRFKNVLKDINFQGFF
jgi:hypothetical protein